eukprot:11451939-Alexandrium_andersonii.AAC.1
MVDVATVAAPGPVGGCRPHPAARHKRGMGRRHRSSRTGAGSGPPPGTAAWRTRAGRCGTRRNRTGRCRPTAHRGLRRASGGA